MQPNQRKIDLATRFLQNEQQQQQSFIHSNGNVLQHTRQEINQLLSRLSSNSINIGQQSSSPNIGNLINVTDDEDSRVSRNEFMFHFIHVMMFRIGRFWDVTNKLNVSFHSCETLQVEMIAKIIERYLEVSLLDLCIVDRNCLSLYHIATEYDVHSVFKLLSNVDNDVLKYKNNINFGKCVINIDESKYFDRGKIHVRILIPKMNEQMKYEIQFIVNRLKFKRCFVGNFHKKK